MFNNFGDNGNFDNEYNRNNEVSSTQENEDENRRENNLSGVAKIKVIGVGGAGNNAVNRLIDSGLKSAEYIVVNTDNQALARSKASNRIQIGVKLTKGLGAGADPAIGRSAAEENKDVIQAVLKNTDLLFITAGMGGGTGTGAAPIIAKISKEMKILTVAVVTLPFSFEAKHRMDNALAGVEELKKVVDSIIIIPNDKIRQVVPAGTSFPEALKVADEVLRQGIRGIAELIVNPSLINLDFADVKTTLKGRGLAHMGIGVAKGEKRISDAVRCAVCSPLLTTTIEGASSVIINIVGGKDLSLDEVDTAVNLVKGVIDYSANVIFGSCIDETMSDEVEVVIIASGFNKNEPLTGMDDPQLSAQRVSYLSNKINQAYNNSAYMKRNNTENNNVTPNYAGPDYNPNNFNDGRFMNNQPSPYGDNNQMNNNGYGQPQGYNYPNQQMNNYPNQPVYNNGFNQGMGGNMPSYADGGQNYQGMNNSFEPDDPIPDEKVDTENQEPVKKHRPKFVDYFIKKNSENK